MQGYLIKVKRAQAWFKSFVLKQIPRGQNSYADSLAMLATSLGLCLPRVIIMEDVVTPSHEEQLSIGGHSIQLGPSWMNPLVIFLRQGSLPEDKDKAEKIRRKNSRYWLSEEQKLHKCSHLGPYLLCVHPKAVDPLLEELHEGICGSQTGGRSLSHRALTQGYWWSSMQKATQYYVKKCDQCQRYASNIHQPRGVLNPLSSPWPFA
ncbi:uncharacterized protein LOC142607636 [Castanea sativa]|uniref:uncharacterized protein LOC142607636 n=1 Tax=Castanea sativa TaxID=21020 RepID=UPI003F64F6F0